MNSVLKKLSAIGYIPKYLIINKYLVRKVAIWFDGKRRSEHANGRVIRKPRVKLSKTEVKAFNDYWKGWEKTSFEFYKAFGVPFNPQNVPNDYYDFAEHVLNLRWASFFLQHKCNLKYMIPAANRPKTILQKIDGHYVLEDNTEVSLERAKQILKSNETFIRKVALGLGGGKGVQKICWAEESDPEKLLEQLMKPEDLIFQEVLEQNDFMASFNPDSVNTLRLLTLNINGNCTVLSSFVRMGAKGSFVDNLCSGGGALVGISKDGFLNEFGIKKNYSKCYQASTGIPFKGMKVPDWESVKEKVVEFHQHIPHANLIGWDIAINKDGVPVVVEVNLDHAEVEAHQIFNGPIFGDRFDEVRKYVKRKKPMLRHSVIAY